MSNDVSYSDDIRNLIIANLDGWTVDVPETIIDETISDNEETVEDNNTETESISNEISSETTESQDITPFMTTNEISTKHNKTISDNECRLFYEEALDLAYVHTNRLNIDDLTSVEARMFIRAVCKWAASNLWNKYNIRVNNEDMEDTYIQSYGGLLYKSALKTLQDFINQRITSIANINSKNDDLDNDIWII